MTNKIAGRFSFRSLLAFSFPTIVMMVFMSLYTMVDGFFVARLLGTGALSADNFVYPLVSVVIAVSIMMATGGSAVVARKMGEGDEAGARQDFTLVVLVGVAAAAAITLCGLLFFEPILRFLGAQGDLHLLCAEYARPMLWFVIPAMLQMLFQTFFVTAGHPALGLAVTVLGGVANIVLDYVFIGVLHWGIAGAAVATGIGFSIPALFGLIWFLARRSGTLYFVRPVWRGRMLLQTLGNGSSEMVTNLSTAVITLLFNLMMMRYLGEDGVAAITIVLYTEYLLTAIYLGYSTGIAPIMSYNHGEGNVSQLRRLFWNSMWFLGGCTLVTMAGAYLFARPLVAAFAPSGSAVFAYAVHGFRLYGLCFLFKGVNIYASSLFTALSDGKTSAILSGLRTLVFIVIGMLLLPLALDVDGVWLAVPFAELLSVVLSVCCFRKQVAVKWNPRRRPAAGRGALPHTPPPF